MAVSHPMLAFVFAIMFAVWSTNWCQASAAERPALIEATLKDDPARVRHLLNAGVDPDVFDTNRNTALIFAARDGRTEIARLLIDAGADPGWVDDEQVTPLILASFRNHVAIVEMLLAIDVDRNHHDRWGRSALDYAERRGKDDAIYRLLSD